MPKQRHEQLRAHELEVLKCGVQLAWPVDTGAPAEMIELRGQPEHLDAGKLRFVLFSFLFSGLFSRHLSTQSIVVVFQCFSSDAAGLLLG